MDYFKAEDIFKNINIELNENEYNNFEKYKKILLEWNKKINLTAITKDEEVWIKHFFDSCTIYNIIKNYNIENTKLIDIGTGAGFPSIPLKIIDNKINITMIDSLQKRINFLNEIIKNLKLKEIQAIHGRSEDLSHNNDLREKFDFATARAVANLSTLLEYCMPFIKVGGYFICMKGNNINEEIDNCKNALKILGGDFAKIINLNLPIIKDERNIIVIKKIKSTPKMYSRKAGIPSKNPL